MSLTFGVRRDEEPEYDPMAAEGGNSRYIKYFQDGVTTVRPLEEISDWLKVWMHFNQSKKIEYPCTGDKEKCPGHNSADERERKPSVRYIVNMLNRETGYVDLYKVPWSIIDDFQRQSDKWGTLLDRDYEVIRKKDEKGVSYSIDRLDPDDLDLDEYEDKIAEKQPALQEAFRDVWGGLPDEEDYSGGEVFGLKSKKKKVDSTFEDEVNAAKEDDKPPFNQPDSRKVEEDQEYNEIQLRNMPKKEIIKIFELTGVKVPKKYESKQELVDVLIRELA